MTFLSLAMNQRKKWDNIYLFRFSFKYYVASRWFSTEAEQGTLYTLQGTFARQRYFIHTDLNKNLRTMLVGVFFGPDHLPSFRRMNIAAWTSMKWDEKYLFSASKHTGNRVAPTPCGFSKNCDSHWLGILPDVFLSPSFNIRNNNLQSTAALRETRTTA